MQLLIDSDTESREGLVMAAQVLLVMADIQVDLMALAAAAPPSRHAPKPLKTPAPPAIVPPPVHAPVPPSIPLPPGNLPVAPVQHPPFHPDAIPPAPPADVPAGTEGGDMLDPAQLFKNGGAPVPFVPPAPPAPAAMIPAAPTPNVQTGTAVPGSAPVPPAASGGVVNADRDSEGMPWDARIHSETRKKNADGTWRFRRNLDATVKAAVVAELKLVFPQQPAAAVTSAVPVPPPALAVPQPPAAAASVPVPQVPAAGGVPVAPPGATGTSHIPQPVGVMVPPPPAPDALVLPFPAAPPMHVQPGPVLGVPVVPGSAVVPPAPVTSFRDLMTKVNVALSQGRLTQAQLAEACKSANVDGVTALAAQPMLVPAVDAYLNRWLAAAA